MVAYRFLDETKTAIRSFVAVLDSEALVDLKRIRERQDIIQALWIISLNGAIWIDSLAGL